MDFPAKSPVAVPIYAAALDIMIDARITCTTYNVGDCISLNLEWNPVPGCNPVPDRIDLGSIRCYNNSGCDT